MLQMLGVEGRGMRLRGVTLEPRDLCQSVNIVDWETLILVGSRLTVKREITKSGETI